MRTQTLDLLSNHRNLNSHRSKLVPAPRAGRPVRQKKVKQGLESRKWMSFSFADLGFWRLAILSFVLELLHLILESHWPAIQGSRLGARTMGARYFMLLEVVVLITALAAAIGSVAKMGKANPRPASQIAAVSFAALCLLGMFFFVWQS